MRAGTAADVHGWRRDSQAAVTAPSAAIAASPSGAVGEAGSAPRVLSGRSAQFQSIVRRVQIGLLGQGYYQGDVDGEVGPSMRAALREFQSAVGLTVTGTITPETLDALKISSD